VRDESFYQIAGDKNNAGHNTVWTDVYVNKAGNGLMVTASTPVYDRKGQYIGAAGVDLMLDRIINDILGKKSTLSDRPQDMMNSFFAFLIDRKGKSIVFPSAYAKIFGLGAGKSVSLSPGFVYGYSLLDAADAEVGKIGQDMIEKDHESARFFPEGNPYIISFHSIPSTEWRIGIAVPESAVFSPLQETLDALNIKAEKLSIGCFSAAFFFIIFALIVGAAFLMRYFVKAPPVEKTDEIKKEESGKEENFIEEFVIEEDLTIEDLTIEDLIIEEETAKQPAIAEENAALDLAASYSKLVKALQKVTEVEKEHSVKLQEEISERRRVEEEIRHLSSRLINSNEEGRKALAQDLHDEFGQTLAALHMSAESLHSSIPEELKEQKEKIGSLIQLIEHLGDKIRSISSDLRPDLLDDLGLVPTLEWYIKEFHEKKQDIRLNFQAIGFVRKRLSPDAELVLYRIFQESINNIVKHAKAQETNVTLTYSHPNVIFIIKDNGVGFDEKTRGKDGIGLLGMRERVVAMKGIIDIRSAIGKGTTVRVELPVA
jgi:signal transduction histidine kinase